MTNTNPHDHHRRMEKRVWTKDAIAVNILGYVLIGLFALFCLIPFYLVIIASFTPEASLIRDGYPIFPRGFSLESYALCLKNPESVVIAYANTIGITLVGTFMAIFLATMTGYVLSRKDFPWRNKFAFFYFFTTLFNGGLVPWYLLCVRYLNFKNNYYGLILPLMFSVWNMIIAKSFMSGLPMELTESAKIDGANDMVIFLKLILPLSKPLIATLSLFSALAYWNDWFTALIYLPGTEKAPLPLVLRNVLIKSSVAASQASTISGGYAELNKLTEMIKFSSIIVAAAPMLIIFPFVQKYFEKGMMAGAVKG
mgnify:CR=1 FL=1